MHTLAEIEQYLASCDGTQIRDSGHWVIRCPHPDHADHHPSASYDPTDGSWRCFGCGRYGSKESIMSTQAQITNQPAEAAAVLDAESTWERLFDALQYNRVGYQYWTETRGLDPAMVSRCKLGYDEAKNRVSIPYFDPVDGKLNRLKFRYLSTKGRRKYSYLPGGRKRSWYQVPGQSAQAKACFVFEGEIDAITSAQLIPEYPAYASGGATSVSEDTLETIKNLYSRVYVVPDPDVAAEDNLVRLKRYLGRDVVYRVRLPTDVKDLNELLVKYGAEQAEHIYRAACKSAMPAVSPLIRQMSDAKEEFMRYYTDGTYRGYSTGYEEMDQLFGGFTPGSLTGLMALPGGGKSTMLMCWTRHLAMAPTNLPLLVLSLDTSFEYSGVSKLLSYDHETNILQAGYTKDELDLKMEASLQQMKNIHFVKTKRRMGFDELEDIIADAYHSLGVKGLVVDYLQNLVEDETDAAEMGRAMHWLRHLTQHICPGMFIILAIQPKRVNNGTSFSTSKNKPDPRESWLKLRDFKGGASIEAELDVGLSLNRFAGRTYLQSLKIRSDFVEQPCGSWLQVDFSPTKFLYSCGPVMGPDAGLLEEESVNPNGFLDSV